MKRCGFWAMALGCWAVLGGCAQKPAPEPAPAGEPAIEAPKPPAQPATVDDVVERMDFWLGIAAPPPGPEAPALAAYGYSVGVREFEFGLKQFLAGRERTPELEGAYRSQLEDQFLILRWIEDGTLGGDPDFRIAARLRLREQVARLALETAPAEPPSEGEIRALYDARRDQYRVREAAVVRMIQVAREEDAQSANERLAGGEPFASVAKALSLHESAERGGELPPFERGTYDARFEERAFAMAPGEVATVATPTGVFVLQKIAARPASVTAYEEVRDELARELSEKKRQQAREALLDHIRRTSRR